MAKDRFGMDWSKIRGTWFWKRPLLHRRMFFRHAATALGGYFLLPQRPFERVAHAAARPISKAKNCIFVFMTGGPSHIDTFDLKVGPWTPANFNATTYDGLAWPQGLFPKLADQIDRIALVRSIKSWNGAHDIAQNWVQIGRNPIASTSRVAPHIGSVVSLELSAAQGPATLPAFLNMNTGTGRGQGYLAPEHAPFYVSPGGGGLANTSHFDGQPAFNRRMDLLKDLGSVGLDGVDLGASALEAERWAEASRKLMYNPDVARVFTFAADERARYGNSGFGNACIAARNLLRAKLGTRFIQINVGSWDMHAGIYQTGLNAANANSLGRLFDSALGTLIADLATDGLLDETLIVAMGEFGRTLGTVNTTNGRDHFLQQSALFAGAGIRGRRAIGETDERGANTLHPGWSRERDIRDEDIEATIYSALGIDWTIIRRDDPLGRGFEYVPFSAQDLYGPIHELWG